MRAILCVIRSSEVVHSPKYSIFMCHAILGTAHYIALTELQLFQMRRINTHVTTQIFYNLFAETQETTNFISFENSNV